MLIVIDVAHVRYMEWKDGIDLERMVHTPIILGQ